MPGVRIGLANRRKYNADAKLTLVGLLDDQAITGVSYLWSMDPPIVDLASLSSTRSGDAEANLVLLPNVLTPGGAFTFSLRASLSGGSATASVALTMNRPPYGAHAPALRDIRLRGPSRLFCPRSTAFDACASQLPCRRWAPSDALYAT